MRKLVAWLGLLLPIAAAAQSFQVTGTVVDHLTNRPLNHVLVSLTMAAKDGASVSALTEGDGRFVFTEVPKGKYHLTAQRPGETPQGFNQNAGFTTAIAVGSGVPTDNLLFPLRAHGAITGSVVDEQGEPVNGAVVQLFMQAVANGELQTNPVRGANTNSSGEFHLGRLRAGTYFAAVSGRPWYSTSGQRNEVKFAGGSDHATSPQGADTDVAYPVTWYGNTTNGETASPIVLAEGATANVQIALHAAPAIHIQLPPSLVSSPKEFAGGANVFARGPGNVRVALVAMFGFNRDDMVRELTGIPAGRYEVALRPTDPKEGGGPGATETLDLIDGMTLPLPSTSQLSVGGQVTFVSGDRPEKELEIYISGNGGRSVMARIAEDGTFSFPSDQLTAGSYIVHFNGSGVWIQSVAIKGGKRFGERLEIPGGGSVVLSIVAATVAHLTKLEGFATRDGFAFAGATVLLMPQDLGETKLIRRDQSDSDGSFTLPGVVPGRYTVIAVEDGADLLYKTALVMKPYLGGGVSITVPPQSADVLKVPVQKRIVN